MILKMIISFYRWLWGYEPLVPPDQINAEWELIMALSALVDIIILIILIGEICIFREEISKFFEVLFSKFQKTEKDDEDSNIDF